VPGVAKARKARIAKARKARIAKARKARIAKARKARVAREGAEADEADTGENPDGFKCFNLVNRQQLASFYLDHVLHRYTYILYKFIADAKIYIWKTSGYVTLTVFLARPT